MAKPPWRDDRSAVRSVFLLLGVLWAARSLQAFTEPNFTDPESASDW